MDVASLEPYPGNPNKHPQFQIDLGTKIIKAQWLALAHLHKQALRIYHKGHGRVLFALALGPRKCFSILKTMKTRRQNDGDVLADNKLPEFADIDHSSLRISWKAWTHRMPI